jgi:hypothetical protein
LARRSSDKVLQAIERCLCEYHKSLTEERRIECLEQIIMHCRAWSAGGSARRRSAINALFGVCLRTLARMKNVDPARALEFTLVRDPFGTESEENNLHS